MRRARGVPLRLASKSLRVRALQERALAAGFTGVLCFTLPEALWLASRGWDDLVVGYPTVDRSALRELARGPARERVTVMVDCIEHLDLIAAAEPEGPVRVCIDVDASWRIGGLMTLGPKRSPLHDPVQVAAFAREVAAREHVVLDGLMAYEGQIAGVGDKPPGPPADAARAAGAAGAVRPRARGPARGDRRRGALRRPAAVRQRRRDGLDRAHRGRAGRDRGGRGLRAVRADVVRHLPRVPARAGGVLRAPGRAQADGEARDRAGRRLHRLGRAGA